VTLPEGRLCLSADPFRLEQVFVNLLQNASKYSEAGTTITIDCRSEARDGRQHAVVRVRDEGVGIPRAKLKAIFDLFVQVDQSLARSLGGLGLGLTIARSLVELHGGTISASSEGEGRGAEFRVDLPIEEVAALAPASELPPENALGADAERPLVVLVVEDNLDAREMLQAWLEDLGHRVYTASDGFEGLELARTVNPDVALVDIGLPGLDGYSIARRLRATGPPGVLLVAISGYGQDGDRLRSREAGFDAHLTKPVDPQALDALLAQAGA